MSFSRRLLDYESYIRFRHEGLGIIAGDAVALGLLAKPGPFPRDP